MLSAVMAATLLTACQKKQPEPEVPSGSETSEQSEVPEPDDGWDTADSPELTEEKLDIFYKGFNGLLGVNYIPLAYLGSQVLTGTVHTFLARATVVVPGAKETFALIYLYEEKGGRVRIIDILRSGIETGMDTGEWEPAENPALTDEMKSGFEEAVTGLTGAGYVPVALAGTKVASELDFVVIAEATPVTGNAETGYSFVYLKHETDGKLAITDIKAFEAEIDQPGDTEPEETPTPTPTEVPSPEPTAEPTETPTPTPTETPTPTPTETPTPTPTETPTPAPTETPTPAPTETPTPTPTAEPTPEPTVEPTPEPTVEPTPEPTVEPTPEPTEEPTPEPTPEPIQPGDDAGAWKKAASPALTDDVRRVFAKVADTAIGVRYNPVAFIGTQVVAGTNYAVLCETSLAAPGSQDLYSMVIAHEGTDGSVTVTDVIMSQVNTYTDLPMGGWKNADDPVVHPDMEALFASAARGFLGAEYAPIAVVSMQPANGTNYCIFAEAGKVTADPGSEYAFVYLHVDEGGSAAVTDIVSFK